MRYKNQLGKLVSPKAMNGFYNVLIKIIALDSWMSCRYTFDDLENQFAIRWVSFLCFYVISYPSLTVPNVRYLPSPGPLTRSDPDVLLTPPAFSQTVLCNCLVFMLPSHLLRHRRHKAKLIRSISGMISIGLTRSPRKLRARARRPRWPSYIERYVYIS